jgi:hypothetical protein
VICTDCAWLRERFAQELADNANLLRRLEQAETAARQAGTALDAGTKAEVAALSQELERARQARLLAEGGTEAVKAAEEASAQDLLRGLPEEDLNRILSRVRRGDLKGRPFGTPRNPRLPTIAEFNPKFEQVKTGDLEGLIKDIKHGQFPEQVEQIRKLSNDDLVRFRPEDPISAARSPGGWVLTGGHHRLAEIARRIATGQLPPDTVVKMLIHD